MQIEDLSVRNLVLYFAATCGYVPRKYTHVFSPSPTYSSAAIHSAHSALEKRFITINQVSERISYRKKTDKYIQITMDGLRYLSKHADSLPEECRWVQEIYKATLSCEIICAASGCKVSTPFPLPRDAEDDNGGLCGILPSGDDGMEHIPEQSVTSKRMLSEIIREIIENQKEPEQNRNGVLFNSASEIIFTR